MLEFNFQKTELPNGLKIITEKISGIKSIALGVWVQVGARDESESNNGISHFVEHILFKGTVNRTTKQIAESMEYVGGSLDAFTAKEVTCYSAHFLDEHLPLAVDVLSDIIQNSLFEEAEIAKEKDVIQQEIYHYQDTPEEVIFEFFYNDIFEKHPLGYNIYGTLENVKNFSRDELIDFVDNNYTSDRMLITASGNVNHQELVDLVSRAFRNIGKNSARRFLPAKLGSAHHHKIDYACSQAHICMGTRGIQYNSPQRYPLMVVHMLLGGGMSSRLFQKIREEHGLAYTVFSFNDLFFDTGVFGVYLETDKESFNKAIDLIKREFITLFNDKITEDELIKIKQQLKGSFILSLENTFTRMNRLAEMQMYLDHFNSYEDVIRNINAITAEQVRQISENLFKDDKFYLTYLNPES
ncbi:MAG: M16 family metallopeptidase [Candidatus Zhuqueibacterota bacterium]